jgi:hypothetical protein
VYLQPTTNHRFSLLILEPEKRTLACTMTYTLQDSTKNECNMNISRIYHKTHPI